MLSTGTRLGPYEIVAPLGAGGMGEVYRARDTKLNRDVAIKVLPEAFALDADRLARFTREAQVLASLNHPNIAQIYGIEETTSEVGRGVSGAGPTSEVVSRALVMELVEGRDLSELIRSSEAGSRSSEAGPSGPANTPGLKTRPPSGGFPLADAIAIARQIIDALEAAHEQGIVHRDLKPQNIKVRDDGTVKVLDFGLAKAMDSGTSGPQDSNNSPTLTARATQMGMIIGTAAYMAPEQARGRAVDRRADIWAFGVVLYEMLTGSRGFEGEDISVTLANVIKEDPKWDALPADLHPSIKRLLRRCLEKDPKRRLGAISDARLELDEASSPSEASPAAASVAAPRSGVARWERAIWASVAAVAIVAAVWLAWPSSSDDEATLPMARFEVSPPGEGRFIGNAPRIAISPDGRSLAFSASSKAAEADQLWIRRLDSMEVLPVPGTLSTPDANQPQSPFWSPDSRQLAFFVQTGLEAGGLSRASRLLTADMTGGGVRKICDLPSNNASGTWNSEGVLLVSSQGTKGIQRVSANGGAPTQVTTLDSTTKEIAHLWPQFLPDGRHFLYQAQTDARGDWAIFAGAIDSAARHQVVKSDYARFAAPNLLLYVVGENLMAQRMDMQSRTLTGDPVVLATGMVNLISNGRSGFTVSDAGVLVYASNPDQQSGLANRRLTWLDRRGTPLGPVGPPVSAFNFRLSPDGARAALVELAGDRATGRQLWVADLERNVKAPLASSRGGLSPTWSDDGRRLVFSSTADDGRVTIGERVASGATPMTTLHNETGPTVLLVPLDESSDGKLVVFTRTNSGVRSLYVLSKTDGKVAPYLEDGFDHPQASLSRDGRWLAYTTNESSTYEVVVQPFPDPSQGKWPISAGGGAIPRWRRDGRELFYVNNAAQLVAVPVTTHQELVPGKPQPLFLLPGNLPTISTGAYSYDVSPDGQRILVSIGPGGIGNVSAALPLTVVTNWTSLLTKK
ncbi:MAG: serine/threonine-protein kinase [Acidobacteria bacterium]|jgi:serine/threonine protein kinase|nr:serine/threonine-protein kinase [Acidobacteriota bacterium]